MSTWTSNRWLEVQEVDYDVLQLTRDPDSVTLFRQGEVHAAQLDPSRSLAETPIALSATFNNGGSRKYHVLVNYDARTGVGEITLMIDKNAPAPYPPGP